MAFLSRQASRTLSRSALLRSYATVSDAAGVKVAGVDNGASTIGLSVVVKAGSRYESAPGVAHALKNFAYKATKSGSALKTVREAELYGGVLSSALTREHLFLNVECLRGDEEYFLSLLSSVLSSTKFTDHEFHELVLPTLQSDTLNAIGNPTALAFDLAHQLAFRKGLGNSLFASPHSPLTIEQIKDYGSKAFAKSNIAVIGSGISTESLSKAVNSAFGSSSSTGGSTLSSPSTKYFGGEQRVPLDVHSNPLAQPTIIIAFGSSSAPSQDVEVLPHILGGESPLKWVPGLSPLSVAASKVPGGSAKSFLLPYSDASLFGVILSAPTSESLKGLATEVGGLIKGVKSGLKDEDVKRAVAKAKFEAASALETKEGLVGVAGPQLLSGSVKTLEDTFGSYSKVSTSSLSKAADELFKSKPTVVAVGDLAVLPYADELGL